MLAARLRVSCVEQEAERGSGLVYKMDVPGGVKELNFNYKW